MKYTYCDIQRWAPNPSWASQSLFHIQVSGEMAIFTSEDYWRSFLAGIRRNRNKERRRLKIHTVFIPDVISPYHNGRQDNASAIRSIGFIFIVSELTVSSEAPSAVTFSSLTSQVSAPVDFSPFRLSSLFLITCRPRLKIPLLPASVRRKYRLSLCACRGLSLQRFRRCSDPKANEVLLKALDVKQQSESN